MRYLTCFCLTKEKKPIIETITNTINLIEQMNNQKTPFLKEKNIQKCINWCHKNNMPYNKILHSSVNFS